VTTSGHTGEVISVAFKPDGKTLASASGDKTIKLWDVATGQEQLTLQGHMGGVWGGGICPGWQDPGFGRVGQEGAPVGMRPRGTSWPSSLATPRISGPWLFLPTDGPWQPGVRTARSSSGTWPRATRRLPSQAHTASVYTVAFSPDGNTVAYPASRDGTVRLWDAVSRP